MIFSLKCTRKRLTYRALPEPAGDLTALDLGRVGPGGEGKGRENERKEREGREWRAGKGKERGTSLFLQTDCRY